VLLLLLLLLPLFSCFADDEGLFRGLDGGNDFFDDFDRLRLPVPQPSDVQKPPVCVPFSPSSTISATAACGRLALPILTAAAISGLLAVASSDDRLRFRRLPNNGRSDFFADLLVSPLGVASMQTDK
jgi:hypothetical protein